jgi:hypothetical protein
MIQGIMPTILRLDGLRVVVYPNDHRPAHVHVIGNGCEAVFYLKGPTAHPNCGRITISPPRKSDASSSDWLKT